MRLPVIATFLLFGLTAASCSGAQGVTAACGQAGQWITPTEAQAQPTAPRNVLERMARQQAVLLGEAHDSAEDHRWQLHTLTQLHAQQPKLAIGFEMFPRRVQPALDQWVAGALSEAEFLERADWEKVWGYDAQHYLPLFHFARMNRIPMLALNVERSLIEAIGKQGWEAVPEALKEGVSKPAAPSPAYRKVLRAVFDHHPVKERGDAAFPRFLETQTTWDRAMAQIMAEYLQKNPGGLVVGIIGAGHVRHGHGVVHQLKDLGVANSGVLMTWERGEPCSGLGKDFADAVYLVESPKGNPPRLGVATEQEKEGLRIKQVTTSSVAEAAGLKSGDLIVEIAGLPAKSILSLRTVVQRQTPGTWLPLKIRRGNEEIEIVARFPLGS